MPQIDTTADDMELLSDVSDTLETDDKETKEDDDNYLPAEDEEKVNEEKKEEEKEEKEDEEIESDDEPIFNRPTPKEITAKFPEFFKSFPGVKTALYREKEYTTIFPTVEDARKASDSFEEYSNLSDSVLSGDTKDFYSALKEADEVGNFTAKFLNKLQESDQNLHYQIVAPYVERAVKSFFRFGVSKKSEDLQNAAMLFSEFMFGSEEFAKDKEFEGFKVKERDPELSKQERSFNERQFNDFRDRTLNELGDKLAEVIDKGLPKDIKPAARKAIHRGIIDHLDEVLQDDKAYMNSMGSLWKNSDGSSQARSRIINAYLARAKEPLHSERRKLLSEILGISKEQMDKKRQVSEDNANRKEGNSSTRTPGTNRIVNPKKVNWGKTSDMDILNDKVTFKK